eukprot:GHVT01063447.1.p1 GENE.GHVT01063447.1~~GHVT01063447.1.p1  ORF type:complete len:579 (+),score=151.79 GHVT01063447.1:417-2153(+)
MSSPSPCLAVGGDRWRSSAPPCLGRRLPRGRRLHRLVLSAALPAAVYALLLCPGVRCDNDAARLHEAAAHAGKASPPPDSSWGKPISRIAFGSCANQDKDHSFWNSIAREKPDAWLWMGDAVYAKCPSSRCLEEAYVHIYEADAFQEFVSQIEFLEGTWDDYDYGLNDGGREFADRDKSQTQYLNFVGVPADWPSRRHRRGVYSCNSFIVAPPPGAGPSRPVTGKLLMLDTRYHRDKHFIPSIGSYYFPGSSMLAAASRYVASFLGVGGEYTGDILGQEQWQWLEAQLAGSDADVHVLVSSIQVTTSFPFVESWGHFPASRRRLSKLLRATQPRGLVLLSGDVHFAEMRTDTTFPGGLLEVTSSGLTHSTMDTTLTRLIIGNLLPYYRAIFSSPNSTSSTPENSTNPQDGAPPPLSVPSLASQVSRESYYLGRNFGTLSFELRPRDDAKNEKAFELLVTSRVHMLPSGERALEVVQAFPLAAVAGASARPSASALEGTMAAFPSEFPDGWARLIQQLPWWSQAVRAAALLLLFGWALQLGALLVFLLLKFWCKGKRPRRGSAAARQMQRKNQVKAKDT